MDQQQNNSNSILPWDKPKVKVVMNIFNATVAKVNTVVRKVGTNEEIQR